jgi:transcriptional regulator with XRE-family HTH domain
MSDLAGMDIKLKVGQRIKELRKKLELSQEGLANEAEVDRTYVTDVENGRRNISVEILEKIISALKVSVKDFFDSKEFSKT